MLEYGLLIIMLALAFHVVLMNKLTQAAQIYRINMAVGLRQLHQAGADQAVIDLWIEAMRFAMFRRGRLKYGVLGLVLFRKEARAKVLGLQLAVRALPEDVRAIHDDMDQSLAILLLLLSPYFSTALFVAVLLRYGSVQLARIVPHRDARSALVAAR